MDQLANFLDCNINRINSDPISHLYRPGVYNIDSLSQRAMIEQDPIVKSRILYVVNLGLKTPTEFAIPDCLSNVEKALMLCSMNKFEDALNVLNIPFTCEVVGTDAVTRTGANIAIEVLKSYNTKNIEDCSYIADGFTYPKFKIAILKHEEIVYIYIKMMQLMFEEENYTLKTFRLKAFVKRIFGTEQPIDPRFKRAFAVVSTKVNCFCDEAEKLLNVEIPINDDLFLFPISFMCDMRINLGLVYKGRNLYTEAYRYLEPYPCLMEKIDCLIAMKDSEKAASQIFSYINMIINSQDKGDKIVLSELYLKLAHLYNDPSYFDKAAEVVVSAKAYHLKGLFYFKQKNHDMAVQALQKALEIDPTCEKIRFSYTCVLIEIDRITEAIKILEELRNDDPFNIKISKNLSYCYYRLNDIENTLEALKQAALSDEQAMSQFFILSVKNNMLDYVKWIMPKMPSFALLRGGVCYLAENKLIDLESLKNLVKINPYVDESQFVEIFQYYQ